MGKRNSSLTYSPSIELFPNLNIRKNLGKVTNQFWKLPAFVKKNLAYDEAEAALFNFFKDKSKHRKPRYRVVVQNMENKYYLGLFGHIASSLRDQAPVRIEQFMYRSQNVGESESIFDFLKSRLFINLTRGLKWKSLYGSFCDDVAYRSISLRPISDTVDFFKALRCWRSLQNRNDLINLVIEGVPVGDLVNDSYIRFKPAPTIDLRDTYLFLSLWQAYRDVRRSKYYFARQKPDLYFTPWSVYIQHGISVRMALLRGIRVFAFGNGLDFAKELSVSDWIHSRYTDSYAEDFEKLENKEEKIAMADAALSSRLRGKIDGQLTGMKVSPYNDLDQEIPDVKGAAVLFLHEFFDSVHRHKDMVFPDFWEWACFTIETFQKNGAKLFVKPHPNSMMLTNVAVEDLKKRYPGLNVLPTTISNKKLIDAGMSCVITCCGTIIHEMAYLGIPSIACSRHPHTSFDFCFTAKTKEEYAFFLTNYKNIPLDKEKMRKQSLAFYYMHNLNLEKNEKTLRDLALNLMGHSVYEDSTISGKELVDSFTRLSNLPAYQKHVSQWVDILNKQM